MIDSNNNYFIIGAQKSGTSTIYGLFEYCDQVYAPSEYKDYHLFNDPSLNEKHIKKYKDVEHLYTLHCGVNYMTSYDYIESINREFVNSKYLIILRHPIKRAISAYNYCKRMGVERESIERCFKKELDEESLNFDPNKSYLKHGLYGNLIEKNVLSQIPKSRVGIFLFEEVFRKDSINLEPILDFMGIGSFNYSNSHAVNVGGEAKYRWVNKLLFDKYKLKSAVAKALPVRTRSKIKQTVFEINRKSKKDLFTSTTDIDINILNKLKIYYQNDINLLSSIIGRDLNKFWKF